MNAGLAEKIYVNAKPGAAMTARIADDGTAWWLAWSLLAADALPPRDPDDDDEEEEEEEDEDGEEEPPVVREPDE